MATKKKMLQAAAGSRRGAGLDVEDVFSTYLYVGTGDSTQQTIVNGIDLAGEGGLVWTKSRTNTQSNTLGDSESGLQYYLHTNSTVGHTDPLTGYYNTFNSNGYKIGNSEFTTNELNALGQDFVSWTFRKAPKFFDVVTYTGDGTNGRLVSHNLESVPGAIIIKSTSTAGSWPVYHRSSSDDNASWVQNMFLNSPGPEGGYGRFSPHASQTDTHFSLYNDGNANGVEYVAYLFAHNDGDGEFGPDGDADIIKCGSYTGNGSDQEIDLGFEPQWILTKPTTFSHDWYIWDTMRGFKTYSGADTNNLFLHPNQVNGESDFDGIALTSTGFSLHGASNAANNNGETYIYMAIRRGTKVPESATEVFALQQDDAGDANAPAFRSDFPVDFAIERRVNIADSNYIVPRLTAPNFLKTNNSQPENHGGANAEYVFDYSNGWNSTAGQNANTISYMWKRAPGFSDVVAYTGDGTAGRTVSHNLGVAPEMIWIKQRDSLRNWSVYHTGTDATAPEDYNLPLHLDNDVNINSTHLNSTAPTSSNFTLGSTVVVNESGSDYIAYLFASLDGVSKVGSYTGDGTDGRAIDCGFTAGARFVLIKRTNLTGSWNLWDSVRGIVAGDDPYIELNEAVVEVTTTDSIDPHASGFAVNNNLRTNRSGDEYIFYAIA
jgi:hypothetical protein